MSGETRGEDRCDWYSITGVRCDKRAGHLGLCEVAGSTEGDAVSGVWLIQAIERAEHAEADLAASRQAYIEEYERRVRAEAEVTRLRATYDPLATTLRASAVANVDARHGYTMECAPSPEAHREEYDREEERLREMWRRLGNEGRADAR